MDTPPRDTVRSFHQSAAGTFWILADLDGGVISWSKGGETPRPLEPAELTRLRDLAATVRPEHAMLQPSHLTYAQDESLEIVLAGERCLIDASSGAVCEGPPGELFEALRAVARDAMRR